MGVQNPFRKNVIYSYQNGDIAHSRHFGGGDMAFDLSKFLEIKDITKPIERLIDVLKSAVWTFYEPYYNKNIASTEESIRYLKVETDEKIRDLQIRSENRRQRIDLRRQRNVERIAQKAIEFLPENVPCESPNEDWIFRFFDSAQDFSDDEIQSVWAKILAGEIKRPGSFSYRSIDILKSLRKEEANMFSRVGSYIWKTDYGYEIFDFEKLNAYQKANGLSEKSFHHLKFLGLICPETGLSYSVSKEFNLFPSYFCRSFQIKAEKKINIPCLVLSEAGEELFPISGAQQDPKVVELFRSYIAELGGEVIELGSSK